MKRPSSNGRNATRWIPRENCRRTSALTWLRGADFENAAWSGDEGADDSCVEAVGLRSFYQYRASSPEITGLPASFPCFTLVRTSRNRLNHVKNCIRWPRPDRPNHSVFGPWRTIFICLKCLCKSLPKAFIVNHRLLNRSSRRRSCKTWMAYEHEAQTISFSKIYKVLLMDKGYLYLFMSEKTRQ